VEGGWKTTRQKNKGNRHKDIFYINYLDYFILYFIKDTMIEMG
jgi:hypothetical protein